MPHDRIGTSALRVVIFGTSSCRDDYRARLTIMADALERLHPDIILLQEVFATADRYNTAAYIARRLGLDCAFHPARPKVRYLDGRPIDSHSGLAVLARHPIVASMRLDLPRDARDGERIAQFCDLDVSGTRLLVVNAQVSPVAGADALRRHQIERLATLIGEATDFDHILVGGDFNSPRGDDPLLAPMRAVAGFSVCEAAPERGVDRFFALTRAGCAPLRLIAPAAALDRADTATGLFPGERPALAATLSQIGANRRLPGIFPLQTAAE